MRTVAIPGLDREVSSVALGMSGANAGNADLHFELLDAFVAAGGRLVDTAHTYGDGEADRTLGRWLADGNRDKVAVIGKGCHPLADGKPRVNPDVIESDLTDSLEWLRTDAIDIYLMHRDDVGVDVGVIVEALNEQLRRGRIRAFGASNWMWERIQAANDYADERGLTGFCVNSPGFSLADSVEVIWPGAVYADDEMLAAHERSQLPLVAWSAQARGFFSGRYSPAGGGNPETALIYASDANFARLARAQELAAAHGVTANDIALAYVLSQPFPTVAVISSRSTDQLHDSMNAAGLVLTPDELAFLKG